MFYHIKGITVNCQEVEDVFRIFEIDDKFFTFLRIQLESVFRGPLFDMRDGILDGLFPAF